ncbi:MAG: SRPBCC family protein [Sumerlaeia bacterium]
MTTLTVRRAIQAPAAVTFAIFNDLQVFEKRNPTVLKVEILSEATSGVGKRWRETRLMHGRQATETMEITAFDPPRSYTVEAESCGARYVTVLSFREDDDGTEVEFRMSAQPLTLMAKAMSAILAPIMTESVRKAIEEDLRILGEAAEEAAAGGGEETGMDRP